MIKDIKIVPPDIEYISQWSDYELPSGHIIVDKGVTGCGYTEYCIRNTKNVVLCSPRKLLLENKFDQHENDPGIFYLKNDKDNNFSDINDLKVNLRDHILKCDFKGIPIKFLVTYDSAYLIIDYLVESGMIDRFFFIIDEFQSLFLDSYFKSEVENDFLEYLQVCPNVLYLSATPMLDKYLERLPEFKDLMFQSLSWKNSKFTETINIQRKHTGSLGRECKKIIGEYLKGNFKVALNTKGELVQSKEAVFYFNSLTDIIRIIKDLGLTPDQVDIICSDTPENRKKLEKIGFTISRVPLKGQPNKMFTFCTSSVYIGADFHSTCASSFVFADPNLKCLALDISLDLPQIVGRQRDKENPFKNNIVIFYKLIRTENLEDRVLFDEKQNQRRESTEAVLSGFNKLSAKEQNEYVLKIRSDIKVSQYSRDFVSISKKTGLPVYNSFIEIANERAWEVSQKDYQDKITVTKSIFKEGYTQEEYRDRDDKIVSDFLDNHFYMTGIFEEKMKMYCEFMDTFKDNIYILDQIIHKVDPKFKTYYDLYGTSGCRSVSYQEIYLKRKIGDSLLEDSLKGRLIKEFKIGDRITLKDIKMRLQNIYTSLNITRTPKAKDLEQYFSVEELKLQDSLTKKRSKGYKIIGIL